MSTIALYYPNATIVDPRRAGLRQSFQKTDLKLLTTAALLWDELQVISPYGGFSVEPVISQDQKPQEESIRQAFDLFIKPRVLKAVEKEKLLTEIKSLISGGVPPVYHFTVKADNFEIYPEKISVEIWECLRNAHLMDENYRVSRDFGLILMGMIADLCAGETISKVTNYNDAHNAYTRLVAARNGIQMDFEPNSHEAYTTLTTISLRSVNAGAFPLDRLVKARLNEDRDGILPPLRRNYRAAVDRYVNRITTEAKSLNDVQQIESEFKSEIVADFNNLRELLQLQLAIPLLTAGFSCLAAISGQPLVALTALGLGLPTYRLRRNETLQKSITGWLHTA